MSILTLYPPQAVRQVVLAVHCLVAGGDVAEVAGLLHAVGWREGFKGKQAVVAVHLRWYVCHKKTRFFFLKAEMHRHFFYNRFFFFNKMHLIIVYVHLKKERGLICSKPATCVF